jgi:quinol monooxygenase YgiN
MISENFRRSTSPFPAMNQPAVSIHPYFKVHPGQLDAAKALLRAFVEKTQSEPLCVYYEFTINGDVVFCREAYRGAEGTLAHLANVGAILADMFKISDVERLEIHGPADELEKLKGPLAEFKPTWFAYECGIERK